jgi:S1-C subfamily serine protease
LRRFRGPLALAVAASILAFGITTGNITAQPLGHIAQKAFPSVVLLVMEDQRGQPIALGSGFFVKENIVASNFHVIAEASGGSAKLVGQSRRYAVSAIVAVDERRDLVLLAIDAIKAPPLPIGSSTTAQIGDEVFAVGNPLGLEGTFSPGIISGIRQVDGDPLFQITAPISPGSSGGPVLGRNGDVVGIATATFAGGQNLNFAVPSDFLKDLLSRITQVRPLVPRQRSESTIADRLGGGKSTEGVVGERLTYDSHTQSGDFSLSLVNKLRQPVKDVLGLVLFYDEAQRPIDFSQIKYAGTIPGGLAKRVTGRVEGITEQLNSPALGGFHGAHPSWHPPRVPRFGVEIRILDFRLAE